MLLARGEPAGDRRPGFGLGQAGGERRGEQLLLELLQRAGVVDGELSEPERGPVERVVARAGLRGGDVGEFAADSGGQVAAAAVTAARGQPGSGSAPTRRWVRAAAA